VTPIHHFAQTDLEEEDIFILDVYTSVFVWVGAEANAQEKKRAPEIAEEYMTASGLHHKDTPIITVQSGNEPMLFTCHFLGWDSTKKTRFVDPYEAKLAAEMAKNNKENDEPAQPKVAAPSTGNFKSPSELKMPYSQLAHGSAPPEVDPTMKEQYLTDAEFEQIMGSSRSEFNKLKQWKKNQIKKAAGLF